MKSKLSVLLLFATANIMTTKVFAEVKEFDLTGISKVEVNNGSGNVNIKAIESGKAQVTINKKKFGSHCQMTVEKQKNTLFVEVKQTGFFNTACEVDFDILAPKTVELDLDSGSGDFKINGTSGDLVFNVGSGDVNVDAEVKKLDGKAGSGDLSINGLVAGGSLKTGSGNIKLVYKFAPQAGELDLKTGSGDAEIVLPKTSQVKTSFKAGSGELTNEVGDSPNSHFKISMMAGSGDLHIKKQ